MEEQPKIVERSSRLTPIPRAADQTPPVHETSGSVSGSQAPLPVSILSEKLPQINPDLQENESRIETPFPSDPDHIDEAEDWRQKFIQQTQELLTEREKTNSLEAAKSDCSNEAIAWKAKCSEYEERLKEEQEAHNRTQFKLQQKQQDVGKFIGLLNKANDKLGSAINPFQVRHQVEDSAITSRTKGLRLRIRDFAEEFGEIDASGLSDPQTSYSLFKRYLWASDDSLIHYVELSSARPKIIRAFIWVFLIEEVFDQLSWAPPDIGNALSTLRELIGI